MDLNKIYNIDCMEYMKALPANSINFTLTDIPYNEVQRETNGLEKMKSLDTLGAADKATFNTDEFCKEVYRITSNSICIFCGLEQMSDIVKFFKKQKGTCRVLVYKKTNPVPSNGQYVYLSGIELAVWFKNAVLKRLMHIVKILFLNILFLEERKEYTQLKSTQICLKN